MKKYIYTLCLLGVIVYSCKTQQATKTAAEATVVTANPNNEEMLKGEVLYNQRCERCHDLPKPSDLTVEHWKPIMASMAPKAKLSAEETNWVLAYVNANAKN